MRSAPPTRRAAGASIVPLGLFAVAAFLPTYRECGPVQTAWHGITHGKEWAAAPYALAALLCVLTTAALLGTRARRPRLPASMGPYRQHPPVAEPEPTPGTKLALAAGLPVVAGAAHPVGVLLARGEPPWIVVLPAALGAAIVLRALHAARGWTRWCTILLAWSLQAAFPLGLALAHVVFDLETPGATVAVASLLVVLGVNSIALVAALRRRKA